MWPSWGSRCPPSARTYYLILLYVRASTSPLRRSAALDSDGDAALRTDLSADESDLFMRVLLQWNAGLAKFEDSA
jgi:hypothetical protein